ncbi:hypothetical protein Hanom_Chr11g00977911 [Helianthus anomalus]
MRQSARYCSSVGGVSLRGRLSWRNKGVGGAVGEFRASSAIKLYVEERKKERKIV